MQPVAVQMYYPIDLLLLLVVVVVIVVVVVVVVLLTRVEQGRAISPHAFNTEGEGKMCITCC
jgi:hypothetical protein